MNKHLEIEINKLGYEVFEDKDSDCWDFWLEKDGKYINHLEYAGEECYAIELFTNEKVRNDNYKALAKILVKNALEVDEYNPEEYI